MSPEVWIQEGFEIAKRLVYPFGNQGGTKDKPLRFDAKYMTRMREVAFQRAALGGVRLAAVLNHRLR